MSLRDASARFLFGTMSIPQKEAAIEEYISLLDQSSDIEDMISALEVDVDRLELPPELALRTCDKLLALAKDNRKVACLCATFIPLYDETRNDEVEELRRRCKEE